MGGVAKGLLPAPDSGEPLVTRLRRHAESLGLRCVLVGAAPAYAGLGLPLLADDPPGIGPLGALRALLGAADGAPVLALACDLPYVSAALLQRLITAPQQAENHQPYDVVAPRRSALWEPLCARYAPTVLPVLNTALAAGERSFQALLRRLNVYQLPLSREEEHQLVDWDTPEDLLAR